MGRSCNALFASFRPSRAFRSRRSSARRSQAEPGSSPCSVPQTTNLKNNIELVRIVGYVFSLPFFSIQLGVFPSALIGSLDWRCFRGGRRPIHPYGAFSDRNSRSLQNTTGRPFFCDGCPRDGISTESRGLLCGPTTRLRHFSFSQLGSLQVDSAGSALPSDQRVAAR